MNKLAHHGDGTEAGQGDSPLLATAAIESQHRRRPRKEVLTDIDYIAPQYQDTFLQGLLTLKLWSIFWTLFCGVGSEFVIIFNARFVYGALYGEPPNNDLGTLLTVINGTGSAAGRLAMSFFEVWSQGKRAEDRIPITASFFVPTMCIIVSIVLFLVLPGNSILLAFSLASLGNGFCASVTILALRTLYAKDPAKYYNFGYNAIWLSAIFLNRLLFGEWYAVRASEYGVKVCLHRECIFMPLCVMLGINVTAFASNVYLHVVYTRFSRRVLLERARLKKALGGSEEASEPFATLVEPQDAEVDHHLSTSGAFVDRTDEKR